MGTCAKCKFFVNRRFKGDSEKEDSFKIGDCYRYPPAASLMIRILFDWFGLHVLPQVESSQWCGEFAAREEKQ